MRSCFEGFGDRTGESLLGQLETCKNLKLGHCKQVIDCKADDLSRRAKCSNFSGFKIEGHSNRNDYSLLCIIFAA